MDTLDGNSNSDSEPEHTDQSRKDGISRRQFLKQGLGSAGFLALTALGIGAMMQRNGVQNSDFEDQIDEMLNEMTVKEKIEQLRYDAPPSPDWILKNTTGGMNACTVWVGPAMPPFFRRQSVWPPRGISRCLTM